MSHRLMQINVLTTLLFDASDECTPVNYVVAQGSSLLHVCRPTDTSGVRRGGYIRDVNKKETIYFEQVGTDIRSVIRFSKGT